MKKYFAPLILWSLISVNASAEQLGELQVSTTFTSKSIFNCTVLNNTNEVKTVRSITYSIDQLGVIYSFNPSLTLYNGQNTAFSELELPSNVEIGVGQTIYVTVSYSKGIENLAQYYRGHFIYAYPGAPTTVVLTGMNLTGNQKYWYDLDVTRAANSLPIKAYRVKLFLGTTKIAEEYLQQGLSPKLTDFVSVGVPRTDFVVSNLHSGDQIRFDVTAIGVSDSMTLSQNIPVTFTPQPIELFTQFSDPYFSSNNPVGIFISGDNLERFQFIENGLISEQFYNPGWHWFSFPEGTHSISIKKWDINDFPADSVTISFSVYGPAIKPSLLMNYSVSQVIKKEGVKTPVEARGLTVNEISNSVSYTDDLGRPHSSVAVAASPGQKDIYTFTIYDQYGRVSSKYLPYVSDQNNGELIENGTAKVLAYYAGTGYDANKKIEKTDFPFSKSIIERSPGSTLFESGSPGEDWQPNDGTMRVYQIPEFTGASSSGLTTSEITNQTINYTTPTVPIPNNIRKVKLYNYWNTVVNVSTNSKLLGSIFYTGTINWTINFTDGTSSVLTTTIAPKDSRVKILDIVIPEGKTLSSISSTIQSLSTTVTPPPNTNNGEVFYHTVVTHNTSFRTSVEYSYLISSSAVHTIRNQSRTNNSSEVLMWDCPETGLPSLNYQMYFQQAQITVMETTNEDGKTSLVYKDRSDKEILKKSTNNGIEVLTYYLYDEQGNLRFILPPMAMQELAANGYQITQQIADRWLTEFRYDEYNRVIYKKIPEAEAIFTVYDRLGRIALTQDGNLRLKNQWMFTKYDRQGRSVLTGLYSHPGLITREALADTVYNWPVLWEQPDYAQTGLSLDLYQGYSNSVFPVRNFWLLTVTYYDEYTWPGMDGETGMKDLVLISGYNSSSTNRTLGKVTGSRVRILRDEQVLAGISNGTSVLSGPFYLAGTLQLSVATARLLPGFRSLNGQNLLIKAGANSSNTLQNWMTSVSIYDDEGRVIQSKSRNQAGGIDYSRSDFDFTGKVLKSISVHNKPGNSSVTVKKRWEYDHSDRVLKVWHQANSQSEVLLVKNNYNDLGQLVEKNLYSKDNGVTFYQSLDYRYNIRGWLKNVNQPNPLNTEFSDNDADAFAYELYYQDKPGDFTNTEGVAYNGNITRARWRSQVSGLTNQQYTFGYEYDDLNQITNSNYYNKPNNGTWGKTNEFRESNFTYDLNGNIKSLLRVKNGLAMDDLAFHHLGNRLAKVNETVAASAFPDDQEGNANLDSQIESKTLLFNTMNAGSQSFSVSDRAGAVADPENSSNTVFRLRNIANQKNASVATSSGWIQINPGLTYKLNFTGSTNGYDAKVAIDWFTTQSATTPISSSAISFASVTPGAKTQSFSAPQTATAAKVRLYIGNTLSASSDEYGYFDNVELLEQAAYSYDANGNMTADANKGMTLEYNLLNLPTKITFAGGTIEWIYTASGAKLAKVVTTPSWITQRDYVNGFEYYTDFETTFDRLEQFPMDEGRMRPTTPGGTTYRYELDLKDHLGNTRMTLTDANNNGIFDNYSVEVLQADDYYPFGMRITRKVTSSENNYTYNGKEHENDFGLNWYHYGARYYDPAVGRWWAVDPVDENYSPMVALNNNPIVFIDPDGKRVFVSDDLLKSEWFNSNVLNTEAFQAMCSMFGEGGPLEKFDITLMSDDIKYSGGQTRFNIDGTAIITDVQEIKFDPSVKYSVTLAIELESPDWDQNWKKDPLKNAKTIDHEFSHIVKFVLDILTTKTGGGIEVNGRQHNSVPVGKANWKENMPKLIEASGGKPKTNASYLGYEQKTFFEKVGDFFSNIFN